jgi:ABC-type nickel/cobalt efflux system permease component RcnA
MDFSITAALSLGFVLGLRHAMDADHVAAVAALVSQERSLLSSCLLGTFWGAGHTAALLAAAMVMMALRLTVSPDVERTLELIVAAVLVLLGAHVLLRALAGMLHSHAHTHDGHPHRHAHFHDRRDGALAGAGHAHRHVRLLRLGRRPFLLGIVHGMAGSAALMLLALAAIPSALGGLLYVLVFGIGSTLGMLVLSGIVGIPLALAAGRSPLSVVVLQALAGLISLVLGLWLAYQLIVS